MAPPQQRDESTARFEDLYHQNFRRTVMAALPIVFGNVAAAEDAAQDAFIALARRWGKVSVYDRPELWVRRVAVNRAISVRRKLLRETDGVPEPSVESTFDAGTWDAMRAVSRLPKRQAQVISLVYFGGLSIEQAAETMSIAYETARTHHRRGLERMRQGLGPSARMGRR